MNIFLLCLFFQKRNLQSTILMLEMERQEMEYKKIFFNI